MELYFARHEKTQWNQERHFQRGNGDSPLLPQSYGEIKAFGKKVGYVPFKAIYSSTAKQARDIAEGINRELTRPIEIFYTDKLRELGLGILEGQSIDEMYQKYPDSLLNLHNRLSLYDLSPLHGETTESVIMRIKTVVADVVARYKGGPLLSIEHEASLTTTIQWMTGKELSKLREMGKLFNGSLTTLEAEGPCRLLPYELKI